MSFNNNTDDFDFLSKIRIKFNADDAKLYKFCEASFGAKDNLRNYLSEYVQLFRKLVFVQGLSKTVNKNTKNLFLNILRILNPPAKRLPDPTVRMAYTRAVIQDCIRQGCVELLQEKPNTESSLLLKLIHEKNYERVCIQHIDIIQGKPLDRRVFHFTPVAHQTEERQREACLGHITSCLFEELCMRGIHNNGTRVICSVNSPDTGDALLKSGASVEIKCNANRNTKRLMDKSPCQHAAFGINVPAGAAPPANGMLLHYSFINRNPITLPFNFNSRQGHQECRLTSKNLQDLDEHIATAVVLSDVYLPRAIDRGDLDLSCRALVEGVAGRQPAGVPSLTPCVLFDGAPAARAPIQEMRHMQQLVNNMFPSPSSGEYNNNGRNEYNQIQDEMENKIYKPRAYGKKKGVSLKNKGKTKAKSSNKAKSSKLNKSKSKKGKK